MFGVSSSKDTLDTNTDHDAIPPANKSSAEQSSLTEEDGSTDSSLSASTKSKDEGGADGEKPERRGSIKKASSLFSSAKNSLLHGSGKEPQSPIQKLGKSDPALVVPQGPNNNSAGESNPGPHSTFRVGVTEDRNKKCRRTMEDTHAYLYNFLSTPMPAIPAKGTSSSETFQNLGNTGGNNASSSDPIDTDNGYFAIFDGHAGTFAADWCGKKLHLILEEAVRKSPNTPIPELLDHTFTNADQQLEKLPLKSSGCTAVTAVLRWEDRIPNAQSATGSTNIAPATAAAIKTINEVHKNDDSSEGSLEPPQARKMSISQIKVEAAASAIAPPLTSTPSSAQIKLKEAASRQRVLYTANVGDARIVLCRSGKALRLSYDHKGSDDNEEKRVTNAGGLILNNRVNGVLAVTRALGDVYMKNLVTGHPYTTETVIQPDSDEFLILACDGLWDVCSDQEAVDHIRQITDPQLASKMLVDHALARFSTDNLSCMVVRFNHHNHNQPPQHHQGVDSDLPPEQRGSRSEADAIVAAAAAGVAAPTDAKLKETEESASRTDGMLSK